MIEKVEDSETFIDMSTFSVMVNFRRGTCNRSLRTDYSHPQAPLDAVDEHKRNHCQWPEITTSDFRKNRPY